MLVDIVLSKYNPYWRDSIDNICEPILTYTLVKDMENDPMKGIREQLLFALDKLIQNHYEGNRELGDYLSSAIDNIVCLTQSLHATDF